MKNVHEISPVAQINRYQLRRLIRLKLTIVVNDNVQTGCPERTVDEVREENNKSTVIRPTDNGIQTTHVPYRTQQTGIVRAIKIISPGARAFRYAVSCFILNARRVTIFSALSSLSERNENQKRKKKRQ